MEKDSKVPAVLPGKNESAPFHGYTIEELKYQRAMVALKREFCKVKVMESIEDLRGRGKKKETPSKYPKLALAGKAAQMVFSRLNTLDYVMLGMSAFNVMRKGIRMIKRK